MKIKPEDFDRLNILIKESLANGNLQKPEEWSHVRYIWEVYHMTLHTLQSLYQTTTKQRYLKDYQFIRDLYKYLNDSHIETALQKILPEKLGNNQDEIDSAELTDRIYDTLSGNIGVSPYHVRLNPKRIEQGEVDRTKGLIIFHIDGRNFAISVREIESDYFSRE